MPGCSCTAQNLDEKRTCQRRMLPRHTPPAHSQTPATAPQTTPPPPARPASYLPPEEREKQGVRKDVRSFLETSLDKTGVMSVLLPPKTENAAHLMGTTRCGPFSFFKQAISISFMFIYLNIRIHTSNCVTNASRVCKLALEEALITLTSSGHVTSSTEIVKNHRRP